MYINLPQEKDLIPFKYANKNSYQYLQEGKNNLSWYSSDDLLNFKRKCRHDKVHSKKWKSVEISYKMNDYGFRCDVNFGDLKEKAKDKKRILALGCSHTFGIGLPREMVWCEILSKKLNYELYNLGVPSGSFDTISRVSECWLQIIDPDIIVVQEPELIRREYHKDGVIHNLGGWSNKFLKYGTQLWDNDENVYQAEKNKNLVRYHNTKNVPLYFFNFKIAKRPGDIEKARDGLHYGPTIHARFAELIYNELERNIY